MVDAEEERPEGARCFQAILARTRTVHRAVGPVAYDCVKVIVVRDGSAILFSEFGQKPVTVGDVILLGANTLCGSEPEGHITVTTVSPPRAARCGHRWRTRSCLSAHRAPAKACTS